MIAESVRQGPRASAAGDARSRRARIDARCLPRAIGRSRPGLDHVSGPALGAWFGITGMSGPHELQPSRGHACNSRVSSGIP
jgi:hypothetical protein